MVRIEISDRGPGIPDTMKKDLFKRYGIKSQKTRTGLGLSIVKALVDRYNGSIMVSDRISGKPEEGVKFIIWIPSE
jgi:signal transduction histidine kinase